MPEMALKLCFPYHFAQLLLGCAVLAAARLDPASLRRSRARIPALATIAALVHAHGARLLVDGAQLVPHRPLAMGAPEDPERIAAEVREVCHRFPAPGLPL